MMGDSIEKTLVLIKPDAIGRALVGRIISRFEEKGLAIVGMKMIMPDENVLKGHYAHLCNEPFFPKIMAFMTSAPIIALCFSGFNAVEVTRSLCGVTNARNALPGTIRGDLGMSIRKNLVHASDSPQAALDEIGRFFSEEEIFSYDRVLDEIIYSTDER